MTDTKAAEEQLRWQIEGRNDHNSRRIRLILQALTEERQRTEKATTLLAKEIKALDAKLEDACSARDEERRKREEAERKASLRKRRVRFDPLDAETARYEERIAERVRLADAEAARSKRESLK